MKLFIQRTSVVIFLSTAFVGCTDVGETTQVGAATGGVLGAGIGALVGSTTGDAGGGLVIGGAIGAGTGAAVGNTIQAQQEAVLFLDSGDF